jgi:hypothetical protein
VALAGAQLALSASPALAVDHNLRIREVFAGSTVGSQGAARFVELQLANSGQAQLAGNRVHFYDAAGTVINTSTFSAAMANGANQASVLVATTQAESFFGVDADLTMPASGIPPKGGQVCYEDVDDSTQGFRDCVAWGNFAGASPSPTGNPFNPANGIPDGKSILRDISAGNPALLETGSGGADGGDDTNDSAADFDAAFADPRNNAGALMTTDGDASVDAVGELDFTAAAGVKNRLTVAASGAFWRLTETEAPITAGPGCEQVIVNRVRCAQAAVTGLSLNGGDENDRITTADGVDATVNGGAGDDMLTTKNGGDTLLGGPGKDILDGGTGPDAMFGEDQQDTVTYERRSAGQPVVVDLDDGISGNEGGAVDDDGSGQRDTILTVENLKGGAGADSITGSAGSNTLTGGAGIDELFGAAANDTIRANGDGSGDTGNCGPGVNDKLFADPADVFDLEGPNACEIVN